MIERRPESFLAENVLHQAQYHSTSRTRESEVPINALRKVAGNERSKKRSEIDSHVKDGKAGVATRIAGFVQRTDKCADVRLQQSCADDDQRKSGIKSRKRFEC